MKTINEVLKCMYTNPTSIKYEDLEQFPLNTLVPIRGKDDNTLQYVIVTDFDYDTPPSPEQRVLYFCNSICVNGGHADKFKKHLPDISLSLETKDHTSIYHIVGTRSITGSIIGGSVVSHQIYVLDDTMYKELPTGIELFRPVKFLPVNAND